MSSCTKQEKIPVCVCVCCYCCCCSCFGGCYFVLFLVFVVVCFDRENSRTVTLQTKTKTPNVKTFLMEQFSPIQFKMISTHSGKPIRAPPHHLKVSPVPLNTETVATPVCLTMTFSPSFKEDRLALLLSTLLSSTWSMV